MYKINKKYIAIIFVVIIILASIIYYIKINKDDEMVVNTSEELVVVNKNNTQIEEVKEESIFVHISGAVNNEGVIEIQSNTRIKDAVDMAGGLKEDADLSDINLAQVLEDGIKIYIPTKEEQKQKLETEGNNTTKVENISSKNIRKTNTVNINAASQTELETLPGIGPSIALKIVNYRKENGKFSKIEDIKNVSGIGESKFNKIKDFIRVK